jgi:hypothetical protein
MKNGCVATAEWVRLAWRQDAPTNPLPHQGEGKLEGWRNGEHWGMR